MSPETEPRRDGELVVGCKFHLTGRVLFFDPGPRDVPALRRGQRVVVDLRHGQELATVAVAPHRRSIRGPLPKVVRVASAEDLARAAAAETRAHAALVTARDRIRAHGLPMKAFHAESAGGRIVIQFAAENRIDFRELLRELGAALGARIELRQVGVRDEAKAVGGLGTCGRELCCTTFLPSFAPVSIRHAKHQNLALAPGKVSGQCGRLKCCLVYEDAQYVEASRSLPKLGKRVETPDGIGRVSDLDVLGARIRVSFEDRPPKVFGPDEVRPLAPPAGPGAQPPPSEGGGPDD